jgi:hypothetical protein
MNRDRLFAFLQKQKKAVLLEYLEAAFDAMSVEDRDDVFGDAVAKAPPRQVDGESLLEEIKFFQTESLAGAYYQYFHINSKNFMHVPEQTREWFDELGDFLQDSIRLSEKGDHAWAVACFEIQLQLIDAMEEGKKIVFAEELGSWMIPGEKKQWTAAYLKSLAATTDPEGYAAKAVPLIQDDSYHSCSAGAYKSAVQAANKEQRALLEAEVQRCNIRTSYGS